MPKIKSLSELVRRGDQAYAAPSTPRLEALKMEAARAQLYRMVDEAEAGLAAGDVIDARRSQQEIRERYGFAEYALLTETSDGLAIQTLELADGDEELTVKLLRNLVDLGYDGEELIEKYAEIKPKLASFIRAIEKSESDIAAGRVCDFDQMQQDLREKHGL